MIVINTLNHWEHMPYVNVKNQCREKSSKSLDTKRIENKIKCKSEQNYIKKKVWDNFRAVSINNIESIQVIRYVSKENRNRSQNIGSDSASMLLKATYYLGILPR